jgi:lipopolysaccharide cholinephosphotransferase
VDSIFRRSNVTYFLDYGALLGSVRHRGWIPFDRDGDIDIGVLNSQEGQIKELMPVITEECGFDVIHRDFYPFLPSWSSFVIRRSVFRVFCGPWVPYFVDVADYEVVRDPQTKEEYLTDSHFPQLNIRYPLGKIFPLRECEFEGFSFPCPADPEFVLVSVYGADWRIPKRNANAAH